MSTTLITGKLSQESCMWWLDELKAFDDCLSKIPQAAGVRRLLSQVKNNHGQ